MNDKDPFNLKAGSPQVHPNVRPRDAATLILVDRTGAAPRVLMGKRHAGHVFMPGKYVFPGGRVDPTDHTVPVASPLAPIVEDKLLRDTTKMGSARARALAVAALREICEETGICIGKPDKGAPALDHGPWKPYAQAGQLPDLSGLHFIARAITPPRVIRRFDTRFFALDASAISHQVEGIVGPDSELVELAWLTFDEACGQNLPRITHRVLEELLDQIKAGLAFDSPAPFYRQLHGKMVRKLI